MVYPSLGADTKPGQSPGIRPSPDGVEQPIGVRFPTLVTNRMVAETDGSSNRDNHSRGEDPAALRPVPSIGAPSDCKRIPGFSLRQHRGRSRLARPKDARGGVPYRSSDQCYAHLVQEVGRASFPGRSLTNRHARCPILAPPAAFTCPGTSGALPGKPAWAGAGRPTGVGCPRQSA